MSIVIKGVKSGIVLDSETRHTYKDVNFDFEIGRAPRNPALFSSNNKLDLVELIDESSIKNSLKTLFSTRKGQKAINPEYGMNIESYLFTNILEENANMMAGEILEAIEKWEPRVVVNQVSVIPNIEENEYDIIINISVPSFGNRNIAFMGIFKDSAFTTVN